MQICLLLVITGCVTTPTVEPGLKGAAYQVSLPEVRLEEDEYIQFIEVEVRCGSVVSINRFLDDWDTEVIWDTPELLFLRCHARHFSAGLSSTKRLAGFITVQENSECALRVTARLTTSSTDPTGRPDRELAIGLKEMVLRPTKLHGQP